MKTQIQTRIGLAMALTLVLLGGLAPRAYGQGAIGGTITQDGSGYWVHTFTSGENFQITNPGGLENVEVLVVGGGGGGAAAGGGGGAGGVIYTNLTLAAGTYAITVGAGGLGATDRTIAPNTGNGAYNGSNSTFGTLLTAYGGGAGAGGKAPGTRAGIGGGSGGGAGSGGSGTALGGSGTNGQGNAGGGVSSANSNFGGGGGGAGGPGGDAPSSGYGGTGGLSTNFNISGTSTRYASGGGGAGSPSVGLPGGSVDPLGGGGTAGTGLNSQANAANAASNTGGGGGAAFSSSNVGDGGNGGSGIVIVRYAQPSVLITATTPNAYEQATQAGVFTVSRGSRTDGDLIVNFTLASGGVNATPGAANDYTLSGIGVTWVDGATSGSVTIPNGAVSATITVTPVDDVIYDPEETVIPTLTASGKYIVGSPANATVTIHDNETGNAAPVVSAGANQTVLNSALPIVATLAGSVTDDGQPNPPGVVSQLWTKVSGPGTVTFGNATNTTTTANFSAEGVYLLQLWADDSALQASNTVTVSVYLRQVTVQATDALGRTNASDNADFTVYRPVTCTNETLAIYYTLGGTAVSNTDYSIAPVSGAVSLNPGQTNTVITVTPVYKQTVQQTVILNLTPGLYALGAQGSATCTLAKVSGPNRYWVATTPGGNWNTTANWSDESGGAGGFSVPASTNVAIFDSSGAGNCALDAAVNVAGINIASGYVGAISQGAVTITVGSNGWTQAGGTFSGSASAITMNGPFSLSGGTFTGTSGTMTMNGNWTHTGGTFNHNNGTVAFYRQYRASAYLISVPTTETFNNLSVSSYEDLALDLNGNTLVVLGAFANNGGVNEVNPDKFDNGTLELRGNMVIAANTAAGTAKVKLAGYGNQTYTYTSGGAPPGGTWTIDKSGGAFSLLTDLSLTASGQQLVWTNGAVDLSSNTLTVAGATTVYPGATTLGVTVADSTKAGKLLCRNAVNSITNVGLSVARTATEAQMDGVTYTILTNTAAFGAATFESVSWPVLWTGDVAYAANGGKAVTLASIRREVITAPPYVSNTNGVTGLGVGTATLNGVVTATNGAVCYGKLFWGPDDGSNNAAAWANTNDIVAAVAEEVLFSVTLSNLLYGVQYYYRAAASNSYGLGWATNSIGLATPAALAVGITNTPASGLTSTSAVMNATLSGTGSVFSVYGYYWTNGAAASNVVSVGAYTNAVSTNLNATLSGLLPGTAYAYTFLATNMVTNFWASPAASFTTAVATVTLTATVASAYEHDTAPTAGVFTVSRGGVTNGALNVCYSISGGATPGDGAGGDFTNNPAADYVNKTGVVTIASGASSATVSIWPVDDLTPEPPESVILTLLTNASYIVGSHSNDTVTIYDDDAGNATPIVTIPGGDQYLLSNSLPIVATLTGNVVDDGEPNPPGVVSQLWTKVNGPGTVTFGDATNTTTTASFDTEGVYVLQLWADDSELQASNTVTVSVYLRQVTVQATDALGRTNASDNADFTVYRPVTCTNETLAIYYTLGGTAVSNTDYSIAPVSGAVSLTPGQTNAVITVTPFYKQAIEQTVILNLTPGLYALGAQGSATCTLAQVTGPDRYWVASSAGNWSDTNNWSMGSGGPGGSSVPGSGSVAIFDGGGAGNCALDAAVNVAGINIGSGYGGTNTQGAVTITVGSNGWTQAGGTFTGSASAITMNGPISLSGGTFTGTSGTMTMNGNWSHTAGTFSHNNGTVAFYRQFRGSPVLSYIISVPTTETFNNLSVSSYENLALDLNGNTLVVLGTFANNGGVNEYNPDKFDNGTLELRGNIAMGTYTAAGTAAVKLTGSGNQTYTTSGGVPPGGTWTIDKSGGAFSLLTDLSLTNSGQQLVWTSGSLNLSSKTLTVAGPVTIHPGATTLGVTVADATTVGRLTCNSAVSGLNNVGLVVNVAATEAQVLGQTYTILSNTSVLGATFESVTWLDGWRGAVAYTANGGKNVTLSSIAKEQGSVFKFR